ncbi:MAG TPA: G1 family glutamic endopeptidase, partial [Thermomicrobiales bacterium]|nr:G1 family glutamic endopeptidase [Thermomicrobiales bacterium]
TTGQRYQTTVAYTSSRSSGEWVEEAPASGRWTVPLDDFGAVAFRQAAAVEGGKTETIAQAGGQAITMVERTGQTLAQPSALGGDGASFSVSRVAAPSLSGAPASGSRFGEAGAVPGTGR